MEAHREVRKSHFIISQCCIEIENSIIFIPLIPLIPLHVQTFPLKSERKQAGFRGKGKK
jgi:hypothetical protein